MAAARTQNADAAIAQRIAELWEQSRPQFAERVALLERVIAGWPDCSAESKAEAAGMAHKLAGALGMFGLPEGTRVARLLEEGLWAQDAPARERLQTWVAELRAVVEARRAKTP